jgi:hypothetical protein
MNDTFSNVLTRAIVRILVGAVDKYQFLYAGLLVFRHEDVMHAELPCGQFIFMTSTLNARCAGMWDVRDVDFPVNE